MKRILTIAAPLLAALFGAFLLLDATFLHSGSATGRVASVESAGTHCRQTVVYQAGGKEYTTTIETNERYSSNPAATCAATVGDSIGVRYDSSNPARAQQGGTTATLLIGSFMLLGGVLAGIAFNGGLGWVGRRRADRRSARVVRSPSSSVLRPEEVDQMRTRADRVGRPPEIDS